MGVLGHMEIISLLGKIIVGISNDSEKGGYAQSNQPLIIVWKIDLVTSLSLHQSTLN